MITKEIKKIGSSKKELKSFGITMAAAFLLLAGLVFLRGKSSYVYFVWVSLLFLALGYIYPEVLRPVHKLWMTFSILLGWLMTRVILFIVFFFVVTPIGILMRLFDRNFMSLKIENDKQSYWIRKKTAKKGKEDYEKQF